MEQQTQLNKHNKQEYPPMHSAEHLLNQTMVRMFGCDRSKNTHIEKKKSKCDYLLKEALTPEQIADIESAVNAQIKRDLPVNVIFVDRDNVPANVDLSKLPEDVNETLRLVTIGDYDICACIGEHVKSTGEIGTFKITSYSYDNGTLRLRFKLIDTAP